MVSSLILVACLSAPPQDECVDGNCRFPVAVMIVEKVKEAEPLKTAAKAPFVLVDKVVEKKPVRTQVKNTVGFFRDKKPLRRLLFPRCR